MMASFLSFGFIALAVGLINGAPLPSDLAYLNIDPLGDIQALFRPDVIDTVLPLLNDGLDLGENAEPYLLKKAAALGEDGAGFPEGLLDGGDSPIDALGGLDGLPDLVGADGDILDGGILDGADGILDGSILDGLPIGVDGVDGILGGDGETLDGGILDGGILDGADGILDGSILDGQPIGVDGLDGILEGDGENLDGGILDGGILDGADGILDGSILDGQPTGVDGVDGILGYDGIDDIIGGGSGVSGGILNGLTINENDNITINENGGLTINENGNPPVNFPNGGSDGDEYPSDNYSAGSGTSISSSGISPGDGYEYGFIDNNSGSGASSSSYGFSDSEYLIDTYSAGSGTSSSSSEFTPEGIPKSRESEYAIDEGDYSDIDDLSYTGPGPSDSEFDDLSYTGPGPSDSGYSNDPSDADGGDSNTEAGNMTPSTPPPPPPTPTPPIPTEV